MKNNVQNYLNILNDSRDLSQNKKLEEEWHKTETGCSLDSFKRSFMAWKKKNSHKEPVKKARLKPQAIVNAFEEIINELMPENNPLGRGEVLHLVQVQVCNAPLSVQGGGICEVVE